LDVQDDENTQYAAQIGLTIDRNYTISESASRSELRKKFHEIFDYIDTAKIEHFVVLKIDRFLRNNQDLADIEKRVMAGLTVHIVRPRIIWTNKISSHERRRIMFDAFLADDEVFQLAERTREGMEAKIKRGQPLRAAYGYWNDQNTKTVLVDDTRSGTAIRIFDLYSTGKYGVDAIAEILNSDKILPPSGVAWTGATIHKILNNPIYCGRIRFKGKIYAGSHTPLVEADLYDKCHAELSRRGHKMERRSYPFNGLMVLKNGSLFSGETAKNHIYYGARTNGRGSARIYIRESLLVEQLNQIIGQLTWTPEFSAEIRTIAKEILRDREKSLSAEIKNLKIRLDKIENQRARLLEYLLDHVLTKSEYQNKKIELDIDYRETVESYTRAQEGTIEQYNRIEYVIDTFENLPSLFKLGSNTERSRILSQLAHRVIISDDKTEIQIEFKKPYSPFILPGLPQIISAGLPVRKSAIFRPLVDAVRTAMAA